MHDIEPDDKTENINLDALAQAQRQAEQAERSHPGIVSFLYRLMLTRNERMSDAFLISNAGWPSRRGRGDRRPGDTRCGELESYRGLGLMLAS